MFVFQGKDAQKTGFAIYPIEKRRELLASSLENLEIAMQKSGMDQFTGKPGGISEANSHFQICLQIIYAMPEKEKAGLYDKVRSAVVRGALLPAKLPPGTATNFVVPSHVQAAYRKARESATIDDNPENISQNALDNLGQLSIHAHAWNTGSQSQSDQLYRDIWLFEHFARLYTQGSRDSSYMRMLGGILPDFLNPMELQGMPKAIFTKSMKETIEACFDAKTRKSFKDAMAQYEK